jgi:hypothetical protein
MSHFSQIKTKMVDEKIVLQALEDLGMKYQQGDQQVMGFGGQKTQVDIRIPLGMSYDVGLRKRGGVYEIVADWIGVRGFTQQEFTQRLTQRYAYHATRDKLEEQGFALVEEEVEETGQIRIVLRRMA